MTARRLFKMCLVDGSLDEERVRQAAKVISDGKWRDKLSLLIAFTKLVKIEMARRQVLVQSATPLTDDEKRRIAEKLETRHGAGLLYTWETEPSLIAGIRVKVADHVTDGTIKSRIAKLQSLAGA